MTSLKEFCAKPKGNINLPASYEHRKNTFLEHEETRRVEAANVTSRLFHTFSNRNHVEGVDLLVPKFHHQSK